MIPAERQPYVLTVTADAVANILRDIPPNTWDTHGLDLIKVMSSRWQLNLTQEEVEFALAEGIAVERSVNTSRFKQYAVSGGRFSGVSLASSEGTILPKNTSEQAGSFVTGGRLTGDQVILETEYGQVNTTTERILSFRLFQQDVLRSTGYLYKSKFKKKHEINLEFWLTKLSKVERREDDDTLPLNIFKAYMEEWLMNADTEPKRFEGAIRNKHRAILKEGKEYFFAVDSLMGWLKVVDKERKWKKSEVKIYLQTIYGEHFRADKRLFDVRVFSIMRTRDELCVAEPHRETAGTQEHLPEILNDSGSGEDNAAPNEHPQSSGRGDKTEGHPRTLVQQSNSEGSEGPPPQEDDLPF